MLKILVIFGMSVWACFSSHLKVSDINISSSDFVPCEICPLAKQQRLSFPSSHTKIISVLELIHVDLWGPSQ